VPARVPLRTDGGAPDHDVLVERGEVQLHLADADRFLINSIDFVKISLIFT
jgi:hypothetical protein